MYVYAYVYAYLYVYVYASLMVDVPVDVFCSAAGNRMESSYAFFSSMDAVISLDMCLFLSGCARDPTLSRATNVSVANVKIPPPEALAWTGREIHTV